MTDPEINAAIAEACGWKGKRFERFFAKVIKSEACWMWNGATGSNGYGQFWNGNRNIPAHWFLLKEYPTKGFEACHTCDNKLCVRPDHIFIGTRSDNVLDMIAKGRGNKEARLRACRTMLAKRPPPAKGMNNHECKLTEDQALIAKACPSRYGVATFLARAFQVSLTVICDIRAGKRWTHLPEPDATARQRAEAFLRVVGKWKEPTHV